jgi:hypothetical protein
LGTNVINVNNATNATNANNAISHGSMRFEDSPV